MNRAVGLSERARRPRSVEDIEPTVLALCVELRQANAFADEGRTRAVDLQGQLLAMTVPRLLEIGTARLRKFVKERYLDKTVPLRARRDASDSGKLAISVASNVPAASNSKSRSRGRSRQRKSGSRPRSRSRSASADDGDDEYMQSESSASPKSMSASDSDSDARSSSSRSPRLHSRERQQGFLAAVRLQSAP